MAWSEAPALRQRNLQTGRAMTASDDHKLTRWFHSEEVIAADVFALIERSGPSGPNDELNSGAVATRCIESS